MTVPDPFRAVRRVSLIWMILALVLAACAPLSANFAPAESDSRDSAPANSAPPSGNPSAPDSKSPTPTGPASSSDISGSDPAPSADSAQAADPAPLPTSTPAPNRLPPEQWREWPVVPDMTGRALDIYRAGLTLDLNRGALSKIGDCQSISAALLGPYDHLEQYHLPDDKAYLLETIQQFSGSFDRDGNAVKGGYNAAAVLSPLWADPAACQPGETPLACELRTHRPVFALISLEVWWKGRTPDRYEQYMRQIIDQLIANGTVPILSTKADNVEGDHSINLATARLAYEYDLPLWNWWRAAQDLPNDGLDPTRPDGFHISFDSWPVRSETALETVDALWRDLEAAAQPEQAAASAPSPTSTPVPTAPAEIQSLALELGPASVSPGSELVFDLFAGGAGRGIFTLSPEGALRQIAGPGWILQAVSPDGSYLLASQGSRLALLERSGAMGFELSSTFTPALQPAALFAADGSALLWSSADGISLLPLDGSPLRRIAFPEPGPIELIPALDPALVYAVAGTCTAPGACERAGVWTVPLTGGEPARLEGIPPAARFAEGQPEGWLVYGFSTPDEDARVALRSPKGTLRELPFPGESIAGLAFDPAGQRLSVLVLNRSGYSGMNFGAQHFLINPQNLGTDQLVDLTGLNARQAWSPDGARLARAATLPTPGGYRLAVEILTAASGKISALTTDDPALSSSEFLYAGLIAWLP